MKFRSRLFWGLAILVLLGTCGIIASASDQVQKEGLPDDCVESASVEVCESAQALGIGIGSMVILCPGLILFMIFALLGWRNGAGYRTERRHQEQLAVARGQGGGS